MRRKPECGHPNRPHYAKQKCNACYQVARLNANPDLRDRYNEVRRVK